MNHKASTITTTSSLVGRTCPISRQTLTVGDRVVICPKYTHAFLETAFVEHITHEKMCPTCRELIVSIQGQPSVSPTLKTAVSSQPLGPPPQSSMPVRPARPASGGGFGLAAVGIVGMALIGLVIMGSQNRAGYG